jgi:hypothetical protein
MRVICVLLLLVAVQARAELVQHGTYVRDTATGIEWMNTGLTLGLSYHRAIADSEGWRHATRRELDNLAKRYIGSAESAYSGGNDFMQTMRVIALLGASYETLGEGGPVRFAAIGYYNDGSTTGGVGLAEFSVSLFVPMNEADPIYPDLFVARWVTLDNFIPPETIAGNIASFMVRRPAP